MRSPGERRKHMLAQVFRDSRPGIPDDHINDVGIAGVGGHADGAAFRRERDGVAQQIGEDPFGNGRVDQQIDTGWRADAARVQTARRRASHDRAQCLIDHRVEGDRPQIHLDIAACDRRRFQHVVDHLQQLPPGVGDIADDFRMFMRARRDHPVFNASL